MAVLRVNDDLSYCMVDGHLIFLDIGNDRYFRLSRPLESSFIRYLQDGDIHAGGISKLLEQRVLTDVVPSHLPPMQRVPTSPTHSALEMTTESTRATSAPAIEVAALVLSTHIQLRTRKLKRVLDRIHRHRDGSPSIPAPSSNEALRAACWAEAFRSARALVPIDTRCLPDSIALTRFLERRRLCVDLVFGVTSAPFSAHCWVQYQGIVLNDTLDHVRAHTTILVI
ncbi:UNVERIFIED_ORG: hypothetical protein FHT06_001515 [Xanthomonas campestris]|uniref:lasso peptide biosynthesis B2 protein n=1 Tax=Xanthomonas arboricola TaxID=56448 RepID=UPI0016B6FB98|nr:lasso peptide biosynthesis B2 protein [Xanthomonas campestris pv. esculenti]